MQQYYKVPGQAQRKNALGSLPGLPYRLKKALQQVIPLSIPMSQPKRGQWLWQHQQEGQTFQTYKCQLHNEVDQKRNVIYIQPLQEMDRDFVRILQQYCQCFFYPLQVKILKTGSLNKITHRVNQNSQRQQYLAKQILVQLQSQLPKDAFCQIGICLSDLYPRQEWNFVFGLASIRKRTGVFSFARYDQNFYSSVKYQINYKTILWRSISVMVHEITHMFGIRHCVHYQCVMNGTNSLEESEYRTLELCVVCLRKLQSNIKFDCLERYTKLMAFVQKYQDTSGKGLQKYLTQVISKIQQNTKK